MSMGSPPFFFEWASRLLPWLFPISFLILMIGLVWGIGFAPSDYKQGDVYRIIFVHVPSAILGQSIYLMMAIFGSICLIWRAKLAGMFLRSAAPLGASFTLIALISGAVWGKPTWGTWWVWDARLTSTLILFFLYVGIIGLYSSIDNKQRGDRAASLISVVGVIIVPIIKKSVDWWQTLHQPSTFSLTSSPTMTADMYLPLLICVIGFYFIFVSLLCNSLRAEILTRERNTGWVRKYLNNKVSE
ncbi:MAG TPA: heme ABC transporter permease [Gammaproteobacteria bacterium]|nr:heme ABC transporter permease [Gammaproteobacteria bacterium]